jgi:hypothetical protein
MWKPGQCLVADRSGLRYPSDLTDTEWAILEPMIPPGRHGGRRRSVNVRVQTGKLKIRGKAMGEQDGSRGETRANRFSRRASPRERTVAVAADWRDW